MEGEAVKDCEVLSNTTCQDGTRIVFRTVAYVTLKFCQVERWSIF